MINFKEFEIAILAGGEGTRLKKLSRNIPKPLMKINNKYFLQYLLDFFVLLEFKQVLISVCFNSEYFIKFLGKRYKNINIKYVFESKPLDTGGAIVNISRYSKKKFLLVMNGDSFPDMHMSQFLSDYREKYEIFIALCKKKNDFQRFGSVSINKEKKVLDFHEKSNFKTGYINAGVYIFKKDLFENVYLKKNSLEKVMFKKFLKDKAFYAWPFVKNLLDIGTPESFFQASEYLKKYQRMELKKFI